MPCRWPSDSELYRVASEELAHEQWLHQRTEEALCRVSTFLIRVLRNPENSIQLSETELGLIPEIETQHLSHRTIELSLRKKTLQVEQQEKQWELDKLKTYEQQAQKNWFTPTANHIAKVSRIEGELEDLEQKIYTLRKLLGSIEVWDEDSIVKVLTERIMWY